jgi:oligogalacturonide transport system permease protein
MQHKEHAVRRYLFRQKSRISQTYGFICIIPWLVGFLAFQLYPLIMSLIYSFTNYAIGRELKFVGFSNYVKMFTADKDYWNSVKVTVTYVLISVPLKLSFSLMIAVILNMKIKCLSFFRTTYYLPSILGGSVGIAILWRTIFNRKGLVNSLLAHIGLGPIDFLGSPKLALFTVSLLSVWQFGSSMVIFLSALQQVPRSLTEAARIDGASKPRVFFSVTLPMISPMIMFNLIMQTIMAFQQFNSPYLITGGGPLKSTYLYGLMMYQNAFNYQKMGYACAQSWVLFIVIVALTAMVFKSSPYWIYYEDGGDF